MQTDEKKFLAQEMIRTIHQFKRIGWQRGSIHELRQSEIVLLNAIKNSVSSDQRGVRVSDLSARLEITPAAVTHMINSMEEDGYIERLADPSDRRIVLIKLTAKGEKIIGLMNERLFERINELVDFLGEDDSKELIRLLSKTFNYFKERKKVNADKL